MYHKSKPYILPWGVDKHKGKKLGRQSMFDDITKQDKVDQKQAPNQYFRTKKKTDLVDTNRMVQSSLFVDLRTFGKISKSPNDSFFETVRKQEKKKIGPNHYKNVDSAVKMTQDRSG